MVITFQAGAQPVSPSDSLKFAEAAKIVLPILKDQDSQSMFTKAWSGAGLSIDQKRVLSDLFYQLHNHPVHLENCVIALLTAPNSPTWGPAKTQALIDILLKVASQYPPQIMGQIYQTLRQFLQSGELYHSNYNQLVVDGGTFEFEYLEPSQDITAPPLEVAEDLTDQTDPVSEEEEWVMDDQGFQVATTDYEETSLFEEEDPEPSAMAPSGPIIKLEDANLIFVTPGDSVVLAGTKGQLVVTQELFEGKGGRMDWTRVGLSADSVFCTFGDYRFNASNPRIRVEQADLMFIGRLDRPARGHFEYQPKSDFPRFVSQQSGYNINLGNDFFHLTGGISLNGTKISTESLDQGGSTLVGQGLSKASLKAVSSSYNLEDTVLRSDGPTSIVIKNGLDSIHHPGMLLSLYLGPSLVRLIEADHSQFKRTPLTATWFHVDIYSSLIDWDLNSDSLDISILKAKNEVPVTFESHDYFNEARFNSLTGLNDFNPLVSAMGYSRKVNSLEFTTLELAESINRDPNIVKQAIVALSYDGYVEYDLETDLLHITRKGAHNFLSQRRRRDYDFLSIASIIADKPNATFDFKTNEMTIRGVEKFFINRDRDVYIEPDSAVITLMADRDFFFDGTVTAGNFQYLGKDFLFNYDSFLIHLPKVESIRLQEVNSGGQDKQGLNNQVIESGGVLYINDPRNKSGLKDLAEYPIYTASSGAVFYFNNPEILDGAYDRTVFFTVPPFTLDSVSHSDPGTVSFQGTFHSGGLFPDFEEKVTVMPDNSLGFIHAIPEEGYDLYGGKGKLYNMLTMDNRGLRSSGTIQFNSTTLESEDFTFYLDSVTASGHQVKVEEVTQQDQNYPDVEGKTYRLSWVPDKDIMQLRNVGEPFVLFQGEAILDGMLELSSLGAGGSGDVRLRGSRTSSPRLTFGSDNFSAAGARFEIESESGQEPHLIGQPMALDFDLQGGMVELQQQRRDSFSVHLPFTQVSSSISDMRWDISERKVYMEKTDEIDIRSSRILTTRPELDSLWFQAQAAVYDLDDHSLLVSGIPYINVADSRVIPQDNSFQIFENASLPRLTQCELQVDTLTGYHRLYDGDIAILSRKSFEGVATYRYVNSMDQSFGIRMTNFSPVEETVGEEIRVYTLATGSATEMDELVVSPGIIFRGNVAMHATRENLVWDGLVRMDMDGPGGATWIRYKNEADLKDVVLSFDEGITESGEMLVAGLFLDEDRDLYGSFLVPKRSNRDHVLFNPQGRLFFDQIEGVYRVQDYSVVTEGSQATNEMVFDPTTNRFELAGKLDLFPAEGAFDAIASMNGDMNLNTGEFKTNTLLALDLEMPSAVFSAIVDEINHWFEQNPKTATSAVPASRVAQFAGDRVARSYEKRMNGPTALYSLSPEFNKSMVFSNLHLEWSKGNRTLFTREHIDLANLKRNQIGAQIEGLLEVAPGKKGKVEIFLDIGEDQWYYLTISGRNGSMITSSPEINRLITDKSEKSKAGELNWDLADLETAQDFVNRYTREYLQTSDAKTLFLKADAE